jgi:hypothetical protein
MIILENNEEKYDIISILCLLYNKIYLKIMKDQNTIVEDESQLEKWNRAKSIFIESLIKPDHHLRSCAHNQKCYNELMQIRDTIVDLAYNMSYPDND